MPYVVLNESTKNLNFERNNLLRNVYVDVVKILKKKI